MLAKYFLITESCLIDSNGKPKEKAIDIIIPFLFVFYLRIQSGN